MKIDTEEEIKLVETLVNRLGRKMAIVVITGGMMLSIQPAETLSELYLLIFRLTQVVSIGLVAITGQLIQGNIDKQNKPETPKIED